MTARRVRGMPAGKTAAVAATSEEEEESDDAPEEVTFESARVAAEDARRLAGERARREKAILKEKRRHREELFKEQKKRKLLPENVLEELASSTKNSYYFLSENKPSDTPEQDQDVQSESENERAEHTVEDSEEEILGTKLQESYRAVRLKDQDLNRQQQAAKEFVQRHLYGAGSNRTTANEFFSVGNKKRAVKKAAFQFVNSSWGKMKKQKARQFTKW
ncbi:nucleolar protein 7 [Hemicordylus capensis]|uniref:nucleolar protein 7 n=1 Tax=Hemicordylus capensis TaxID=884348 RepID=UPI002303FBA5|nr:nucleolar protein 7 [Hemicordylus capensis]